MAEVDAADQLQAAFSAFDELEEGIPQLSKQLEQAKLKTKEAAKRVIAAELPPGLVEEAQRLADALVGKIGVLGWLVLYHILDDTDPHQPRHADPMQRQGSKAAALLKACGYNGYLPTLFDYSDAKAHPAVVSWVQALDRLQQDPDASLPSLD